MMSPSHNQISSEEEMQSLNGGWVFALFIFLLFWIISGIVAFFMSIFCFAYSGTMLEKVGGFAIAVLFGPFYWIYYAFMNTYCASVPATPVKSGRSTSTR